MKELIEQRINRYKEDLKDLRINTSCYTNKEVEELELDKIKINAILTELNYLIILIKNEIYKK